MRSRSRIVILARVLRTGKSHTTTQTYLKMRHHIIQYSTFAALFLGSTYAVQHQIQRPIMAEPNLGPAIPHPAPPASNSPTYDGGSVILSDVLGRDRSINIFAGFTRDIDTVEKRLGSQDSNTTVLAPLNSAIMKLPRKPWEDPKEYESLGTNAYEGTDGEARAHKNLRKFVEAHVVGESPWEEGKKVKTMLGDEVWWETKDGVRVVQPGNIEVQSVGTTVANGEFWVVKSTRNYA